MDSSFSVKNDSKVSVNVFSSLLSSLSVSASSEEAFVRVVEGKMVEMSLVMSDFFCVAADDFDAALRSCRPSSRLKWWC